MQGTVDAILDLIDYSRFNEAASALSGKQPTLETSILRLLLDTETTDRAGVADQLKRILDRHLLTRERIFEGRPATRGLYCRA